MSIISSEKTFILNSKYEIPFTDNFTHLIATINSLLNSEKFNLFYENDNKKIKIISTNFKKFIEKIKNNSNKNINIKALNITNQDDIYNQSEYIFYGDTRNHKINEEPFNKKNYKEMRRINYIKLRKEIQREFNELNDKNKNNNNNDNIKDDKNKKRILNEKNINDEDINNNYTEISNVSHKKKKKGGKKEKKRW